MRRHLWCCAFLTVLLALSAFHAIGISEAPPRLQTILVYMTGSDLETENGAATRDMGEMLRSRFNDEKTAVLVMTGGAEKWQNLPSDQSAIYSLENRKCVEVYSGALMNMGQSESLSFFLNYGFEHYPADTYALILWDHGAGPLEGVCFDENFKADGKMDSLSLAELSDALQESPFGPENKLSWIGFDACLMAAAETAFACAPYAEYMIASQNVEPSTGWDYSFLKPLSEGVTGEEAGRLIIDTYHASKIKSGSAQEFTLSLIDLEKTALIEPALDALFREIAISFDELRYSELVRRFESVPAVGRSVVPTANYDLADISGLSTLIDAGSPAAAQLLSALSESILYSVSDIEGLTGLSVYFPHYNREYYLNDWRRTYPEVAVSEEYLSFLDAYGSIWLGETLANWDEELSICAVSDVENTFSTVLTPQQLTHFASAELFIAIDMTRTAFSNPTHYMFSSRTDRVRAEGNTLIAEDPKTTLVITDADGNVLSESLLFKRVEDYYIINCVLSQTEWFGDDENYRFVNIYCASPDENGYLSIIRIVDRELPNALDDNFISGKKEYSLSDYNYLSIFQNTGPMRRDENGRLLPLDEWMVQGVSGHTFELAPMDHTLCFRMIEREKTGEDYAYLFTVTDTQGNQYTTPPVSIDNPNGTKLFKEDQNDLLISAEGAQLYFRNAEIINGTIINGLMFDYELLCKDNETEADRIHMAVSVNGYTFQDSYLSISIKPGAERELHHSYVPASQLAACGITEIRSLTFTELFTDDFSSYRAGKTHEIVFDPPVCVNLPNTGMPRTSGYEACRLTTPNGVTVEILDLSVSETGKDLLIDVLLENSSDRVVTGTDYNNVRLNGICVYSHSPDPIIPSGQKAVYTITVPNDRSGKFHYSYYPLPPSYENTFGRELFNEIRTLSVYSEDVSPTDEVCFMLPTPFSYAEKAGAAAPSVRSVTVENENSPAFRISYVQLYENQLIFEGHLENATPYSLSSYVSAYVNGEFVSSDMFTDKLYRSCLSRDLTYARICFTLPEDILTAFENGAPETLNLKICFNAGYETDHRFTPLAFSLTLPIPDENGNISIDCIFKPTDTEPR